MFEKEMYQFNHRGGKESLGESDSLSLEKEREIGLGRIYSNSNLLEILNQQEGPRKALFSDIDNTYFREDRATASEVLTNKLEEENIPIVAITGVNFEGVLERIKKGILPAFSVIAGSAGTEIWVKKGGQDNLEYEKDIFYEDLLEKKGFERKELSSLSFELIEKINKNYENVSFTFQDPRSEELFLEKGETSQPFKISFYFYGGMKEVENIADEANKHFPEQEIVVCEEINYSKNLPKDVTRRKYCLDILPITKEGAVQYISGINGIEKGMTAGDSGNDLGMLIDSKSFYPVVVGGRKQELEEEIKKRIIAKKEGNRSFRKIIGKNGEIKSIYIENDSNRLGPESIKRAAEILQRAERVKKIREEKEKNI